MDSPSSSFNLPRTSEEEIMEEVEETHPGTDGLESSISSALPRDGRQPRSSVVASETRAELLDMDGDINIDDDLGDGFGLHTPVSETSENGALPGAATMSSPGPVSMPASVPVIPSSSPQPFSGENPSFPTPFTRSSAPTEEEIQQYIESLRLMYQSLAVMFIIMESWATAHKQLHEPPATDDNPIPYRNTNTRPLPASLIQCILGNVGFPTPLLSLPVLQHTFGLSFPELTTPPPPMPQSFPISPLDWKYPSMPYIEPTLNAATVDPYAPPDWVRQVQIRAASQYMGSASQGIDMSLIATPIAPGAPLGQGRRRVRRAIKPLPKRAQAVFGIGNITSGGEWDVDGGDVVAALAQAAVNVGSAIVTGVKRLRVELEEGGLKRWKKRRGDSV